MAASAFAPARAQSTTTGQQVNYSVTLSGTSADNAEAFQTLVTGGGPNGPGAAQVTMHLLSQKSGWDNSTAPATGEVDPLVVESYQGGPASTTSTADTSAILANAHNNGNGYANGMTAQADQYTPGSSGNPIAQLDSQVANIVEGSAGGSGFDANMIMIPAAHSGAYIAFSANTPGPGSSPVPPQDHWNYFFSGSSPTGVTYYVDYLGNQFNGGTINATGIRDNAAPSYAGNGGLGINTSTCGITVINNNAGANNFTVGSGLPVGCTVYVVQENANATITFVGASGVTAKEKGSTPNHTSTGQYSVARVFVDTSSTFILSGDVN